MVDVFTVGWEKRLIETGSKRPIGNFFTVRVSCLRKEDGQMCYFDKKYEDWLGVCTNRIDDLCHQLGNYFPGITIRYEKFKGNYRKVLPYFEERLKSGKMMPSIGKSFYKLYISASIQDVGEFFDLYKISYYKTDDWLDRIYIDMCIKYSSDSGFFYRWFTVDPNNNNLLESFQLMADCHQIPNWTIAAFDLETVCSEGNRVPDGMDPNDQIVMISVVKWNQFQQQERVFYLNPCKEEPLLLNTSNFIEYSSERQMISDFHTFIQDCQILTGYNINKFDIPCVFARLLFLGMFKILKQYRSKTIGTHLVPSFKNQLTIDAYVYFQTFSGYDLTSFKLDNVAKTKLGGDRKDPVDAVGIHAWYQNTCTRDICLSDDRELCYNTFRPKNIQNKDRFGTFKEYLYYCLQDSKLVQKLFQKEMILEFLIARSNFIAKDITAALYYGNSRFMLEVFKTFGTILGFFVNIDFFKNLTDPSKFKSVLVDGNTYQGALNYCLAQKYFKDVAVLDFVSMYPSCLLSSNLCYSTCTIMNKEEYASLSTTKELTAIPYRVHSDTDFEKNISTTTTTFQYPTFDPEKDDFVIVVDQRTTGFLPTIVAHLLTLRKKHQALWKQTKHVIHYNIQLCIKILINSMYGIMASKDSPLAYLVIGMSITTLARYHILGAYQYAERKGSTVCYIDTDSLMVYDWPVDGCDDINQYLNIPHVELKFEQRMKQLLTLSKKRYVYVSQDGQIHCTGFLKKVNLLTETIAHKIIHAVIDLKGEEGNPSDGWILWVRILNEAFVDCREPKKYSLSRKTKKLEEYKSKTCSSVKLLQKYPEKAGEYIDYTYGRADVSSAISWIMQVSDCQYVDFEKLFINQRRTFCLLLYIGFWQYDKRKINYMYHNSMVLNTMKWKRFVNSELLHKFKDNRRIELIVEKNVRYTFRINEHVQSRRGKGKLIRKNVK